MEGNRREEGSQGREGGREGVINAYKSKHEAKWPQDPSHSGLAQPLALCICTRSVHPSDDRDERENKTQQHKACTDELQ